MDDKAKDIAGINSQAGAQQSGFVILMGLLIIVLGAAAWYASTSGGKSAEMRADFQTEYIAELQHVKERMLTYALLNPEIFDQGDTSNPGPGYFPCPDITGDGDSDTGGDCSSSTSLYGIGWVPQKIIDKRFSFLRSSQDYINKRYWFAVDTRFLVDGAKYSYGSVSNRFAPLNINTPSLVDTTGASYCDGTTGNPVTSTCVPPLTLDGKEDIVMVLFYAGESLSEGLFNERNIDDKSAAERIEYFLEQPSMNVPASSDSLPAVSGHFISKGNGVDPFNDYVIAITREEWNATMLSRVAKDINSNLTPDLCETPLDPDERNWFEECRYLGSPPPYDCSLIELDGGGMMGSMMGSGTPVAVENIEGQGWRKALGCTP